jgi:hypothetical protein
MLIRKSHFIILVNTILLSFCCPIHAQTPQKINTIATIVNDMKLPHEATPNGVPYYYSWLKGPRINMGNNPKKFTAITAWGQLYVQDKGNPATNTRVQIRNTKTYMLSKRDKKWYLLQASTNVEGAAYLEDYSGNKSKPANIRNEKDGSISVIAGNGYNFHFWPKNGRANINSNDVGGVFTTVQARLIIDNPKKPNDNQKARYLLNVGGDYWQNLNALWDNFKTNGEVGMGRFKFVSTQWQAFNMTTVSPDEILRNPPPVE